MTDADIADWYEKQLKSDKELYASNPGQYKVNEEYFEKYCGIYDDAAPALVVPEGYSRNHGYCCYSQRRNSAMTTKKKERTA